MTVNQALSVLMKNIHYKLLKSCLLPYQQRKKLDSSLAYLQLLIEDTSKPYLTINTHQGLYAYNQLSCVISYLSLLSTCT